MPNFKLTTDVIEKTYTSIVSKSFAFPVELNIKKYQFDEIKYPKDIISELRRLPKKKKEEFKNDIYESSQPASPK